MDINNQTIAKAVQENQQLWSLVRRAQPFQDIRRIMREKNISNDDVSARTGISANDLEKILRGSENIQIDVLYSIIDAVEAVLEISIRAA